MLSKSMRKISQVMLVYLLTWVLVFPPFIFAADLPTGGTITGGEATINTGAANLDINQTSTRAVSQWDNFSIGNGFTVNVNQCPTCAHLARDVGGNLSSIYGTLNAQGSFWLSNRAGIYVGQSGVFNVSNLLLSTLNISGQDFMNGNYYFVQDPNSPLSYIYNKGFINAADGGYAALIAPSIINEGIISANLGKVYAAAGEQAVINFGDGLIGFTVDGPITDNIIGPDGQPVSANIMNNGIIQADGGEVVLKTSTAYDVIRSVVNNEGIIEANSFSNNNGVIVIDGGNNGIVENNGTITASAGEAGADGGDIDINGQYVGQFGDISADAIDGSGGNISLYASEDMNIAGGSLITADAGINGDGGVIHNIAEDFFTFADGARMSATGGELSGDGGFIELSGHENFLIAGAVDASAANGNGGEIYLDPVSVTIVNGAFVLPGTIGADTFINPALSAGVGVTVTTTAGPGVGAITQAPGAVISKTGGGPATLTLDSISFGAGSITLTETITSIAGPLNVTLSGGTVAVGAAVTTNGGNFTSSGTTFDNTGIGAGIGSITTAGGTVNIFNSGVTTVGSAINAGGGTAVNFAGSRIDVDALITGNVSGDGASNIFDIGAGSITGTLAGGAGDDTLEDSSGANIWTITGANIGTVTDVTGGWSGFENLTGGTGNDDFTIVAGGSLTKVLTGGNGGGTDSLTVDDSGNTVWVESTGTGRTADLNAGAAGGFTGIENLNGGTGADTFEFDAAATINVDGGAGNDIINLDQAITGTVTGGANDDTVNVDTGGSATTLTGGTGTDTVTVPDGGVTVNITAAGAGNIGGGQAWSQFENVTGGTGADTINIASGGSLTGNVAGGGGADTLTQADGANAWVVTGANTGTVTDLGGWSAITNLTGGTGADTFTINSGATLSGNIVGGLGSDTLAQADGVNAWVITADTFTINAAGDLTGLLNGAAGTDNIVNNVPAVAVTLNVWAPGLGYSGTMNDGTGVPLFPVGFAGIDSISNLAGVSGTFTYAVANGTANTWDVDANTVLDPTVGVAFAIGSGYTTYTGGADDDNFNINNSQAVPVTTLNGAGGTDILTLDYTGGVRLASGALLFAADGGAADAIILGGNTAATVTHTFTNNTDGSIALADIAGAAAEDETITYTGLAPVTDNMSATDRIFDFTGGAETVTITRFSATQTTVDSTLGESVTFTSPTTSMTVNAGTDADTVTLTDLGDDFAANLTLNGDAAGDTLNMGAGGLLPATIQKLTATFEDINVQGSVTTANGIELITDAGAGNDLSFTLGTLTLQTNNGNIDLDTVGGNIILSGGAGTVTLNAVLGDVLLDSVTDSGGATGLTVTAGGNVTTSTIASGALSVSVDANADTVNTGTFGAITSSSVTVDAGGGPLGDNDDTLTFNGLVTSTTGAVNIGGTALGAETAGANTININAGITAATTLDINNATTVNAATGNTIQTTNGDLDIQTGVTALNITGADGTTLTIDGNGDDDVFLAAVTDTLNPNLTVNSEDNVNITSVDMGTGTLTVLIDSDAGDISTGTFGALTAGIINVNTGSVAPNIFDILTFNGLVNSTVGAVNIGTTANGLTTVNINAGITAATSLDVNGATTVNAATGNTIQTLNGDLDIQSGVTTLNITGADGTTLIIDGNDSDDSDGDDVFLAAVTDTNNPNLTVNSAGSVTMTSAAMGTGILDINVDDSSSDNAETGTFGALGAGTINVDGRVSNDTLNFNGTVISNTAGVNVNQANIADFNASVTGATNLTVSNINTDINLATGITLTAQNGYVDMATSVGNIDLDGGAGLVTIQTTGGTGNISLTSVSDAGDNTGLLVQSNPATTSGTVTMTTAGAGGNVLQYLTVISDGDTTIGAVNVDGNTTAETYGILLRETAGGVINVNGDLVSTDGDIFIDTNGAFTVDTNYTATNGVVQIGDDNVNFGKTNMTQGAAGTITHSAGNLRSTNIDVIIVSTGDYNQSGTGSIGTAGASVGGDAYIDPINVDINGAGVYVDSEFYADATNNLRVRANVTAGDYIGLRADSDGSGAGDLTHESGIILSDDHDLDDLGGILLVGNNVTLDVANDATLAGGVNVTGNGTWATITPPETEFGITVLAQNDIIVNEVLSTTDAGAASSIILQSDANLSDITTWNVVIQGTGAAVADGVGSITFNTDFDTVANAGVDTTGAGISADGAISIASADNITIDQTGMTFDADGTDARLGGIPANDLHATAGFAIYSAESIDFNAADSSLTTIDTWGGGGLVTGQAGRNFSAIAAGDRQDYGVTGSAGNAAATTDFTNVNIISGGGFDFVQSGGITLNDIQADWIHAESTASSITVVANADLITDGTDSGTDTIHATGLSIELDAATALTINDNANLDTDYGVAGGGVAGGESNIGLGAGGLMTISGGVGTDSLGTTDVEASNVYVGYDADNNLNAGAGTANPSSIVMNSDDDMLAANTIDIFSEDGITMGDGAGAGYDIVSTNGNINIDADADADATGTFLMRDDSTIVSDADNSAAGTLDIHGEIVTLQAEIAGAGLELDSGGQMQITSDQGVTIGITAGAAETDLNSDANIIITANNGTVTQDDGTIVAATTVVINATNAGNTGAFTQGTSAGGGANADAIQGTSVTITATDDVTIGSDAGAGNNAVEATAGAATITSNNGQVLQTGDADIESTGGDVDINAPDTDAAGTAGNVTFSGTGDVITNGPASDVLIDASGAIAQTNAGAQINSDDDVYINFGAGTGTGVTMSGIGIEADDMIDIDTDAGNVTIDTDAVVQTTDDAQTGSITINADAGAINLNDRAVIIANADLDSANLNMDADSMSLISNGTTNANTPTATEMQAGGWADLRADSGDIVFGTALIATDLTANGPDNSGGNDGYVYVQASQDVIQTEGGGSNMRSTNASVSVLAGRDIWIDPIWANTFVDLAAADDVTITGDITANNSYIYIRADDDGSGAGDVNITGNGNAGTFGSGTDIIADDADNDGDGVVWILGDNVNFGYAAGPVLTTPTIRADGSDINGDIMPPSTREFAVAVLAQDNINYNGTITATEGSIYMYADARANLLGPASTHSHTALSGYGFPGLTEISNLGIAPDGTGAITNNGSGNLQAMGLVSDILMNSPEALIIDNLTEAGRNVLVYSADDVRVTTGTDVGALHGHVIMYADSPLDSDGAGFTGDTLGDGRFVMESDSSIVASLASPTEGYVYIYGVAAQLDDVQAYGQDSPAAGMQNGILVTVNERAQNDDNFVASDSLTDALHIVANGNIESNYLGADIEFVMTDSGGTETDFGDFVQAAGTQMTSGRTILFDSTAAGQLNDVTLAGSITTAEAMTITSYLDDGANDTNNSGAGDDDIGVIDLSTDGTILVGGDLTLTSATGTIQQNNGTVRTDLGDIIYDADTINLSGGTTYAGTGYIDMATVAAVTGSVGNLTTNAMVVEASNGAVAIKLDAPNTGTVTVGGPVTGTAIAGLNFVIDPGTFAYNSDVIMSGNITAWATGSGTVADGVELRSTGGNIVLRADDDGSLMPAFGVSDGVGNLTMKSGSSLVSDTGDIALSGESLMLYDIIAGSEAGDDVIINADLNNDGGTGTTTNGIIRGNTVTINGRSANVTINADPNNTYGNLDINGTAALNLNSDLRAAGSVNIEQAVTLGADSTISGNLNDAGGSVTLQNNLNSDAAGENALLISAGAGAVNIENIGTVTSLESLTITSGGTTTLGGGITTTDGIDLGGAVDVNLDADLALTTSRGELRLDGGAVDGAYELDIVAGDADVYLGVIGGGAGGLSSLDVTANGTTSLAGNIDTDEAGAGDAHVSFSGATGGVVLTSNVTIDTDGAANAAGGSITFQNAAVSGQNFNLSLDTNSNAAVTLDRTDVSTLTLAASANTLYGDVTVDNDVNFSTGGATTLAENVLVTTTNDAVTFGAVTGDGDAATEGLEVQAGTGALTLAAVGQGGGNNPLGYLTTNSGTVALNGAITTAVNGNISITTTDTATGNINVNNNITASGIGSIALTANDDIQIAEATNSTVQAANGDITVKGVNVTIGDTGNDADGIITTTGTGNVKIDASAAFTIENAATDSTSGIDAGGYINIDPTTVTIDEAGLRAGSYVKITATGAVTNNSSIFIDTVDGYVDIDAGSIVQNGNITTTTDVTPLDYVTLKAAGAITDTNDGATDITTNTLNITGATGVGADAGGGPTTTDNGWFDTDVARLNISGVDGSIYVLEDSAITLGTVNAGLAAGEDFAVQNAAGNIILDSVNIAAGTATINSADQIASANFSAVNLTAASANLDAVNSIKLHTAVTNLEAFKSGGVAGELTILETDDVAISAGGISAAGASAISLTAGGDIDLNGNAINGNTTVDVTSLHGSIDGTTGGASNITATGVLSLAAATGIDVDIVTVSSVEAVNTASGDINIRELAAGGNLTVGGNGVTNAGNGDISIGVANGGLNVNAGVTAVGGDINLTATNAAEGTSATITVGALGSVNALAGDISLFAFTAAEGAPGDADGTDAYITINGEVNAGGFIDIFATVSDTGFDTSYIEIDSATLTAGDYVSLFADDYIELADSSIGADNYVEVFTSLDYVNIDTTPITAGTYVDITAENEIDLLDSDIIAGTYVEMYSNSSYIDMNNSPVRAGTYVDIVADDYLTVDTNITAAGTDNLAPTWTIALTATTGDLSIAETENATISTVNGTIGLTGDNILIGNAVNNVEGFVVTSGNGNIDINAVTAFTMANTDDDTSIVRSGGFIDIDPVTVTIDGAGLLAVGDIDVDANDTININGDVVSTAGDVRIEVNETNNSAVGTVNVAANVVGDNVTIEATDAEAGTATVNITGAQDNYRGGYTFEANDGTLNIDSNIGSADFIDLNASGTLSLAANLTAVNNIDVNDVLTLDGVDSGTSTITSTTGNVVFDADIRDSGPANDRSLTVNAVAGTADFNTVGGGAADATDINGLTVDAAKVNLSGATYYVAGNVDIEAGNVVLNGTNVEINTEGSSGNIDFNHSRVDSDTAAARSLTLQAGATGIVTSEGYVGDDYALTSFVVDTDGATRLSGTIVANTSVDLTEATNVDLVEDLTIRSGDGAVAVDLDGGDVAGNFNLTVDAGSGASADVNLDTVDVNSLRVLSAGTGTVSIGDNITTDDGMNFASAGDVNIVAGVTLTNTETGTIDLSGGDVDAAGALDIMASATNVKLGVIDVAAAGELDVNSTGVTTIVGNITTVGGNVAFDGATNVVLGADVVISTGAASGGNIDFVGGTANVNSLSGNFDLDLNAGTGNVEIDNATGLASLDVVDSTSTTISGNVSVEGAIDINATNAVDGTSATITVASTGSLTTTAGDISLDADTEAEAVPADDDATDAVITINGKVNAGGTLTMDADTSDKEDTATLDINADVSGNLTLTSGDDVAIDADVTAAGSSPITITADTDVDGTGNLNIAQAASASVTAVDGNITLQGENITIGNGANKGVVRTIGSGDITITANLEDDAGDGNFTLQGTGSEIDSGGSVDIGNSGDTVIPYDVTIGGDGVHAENNIDIDALNDIDINAPIISVMGGNITMTAGSDIFLSSEGRCRRYCQPDRCKRYRINYWHNK
ncbi:MAG: hypothetical protein HY809_03580 [Nitrospirae bacterium]|nr:hypothetical protein [Nitrospirota bacterium]